MNLRDKIELMLRKAGVENSQEDAEILVNLPCVIVNVPIKSGIITSDSDEIIPINNLPIHARCSCVGNEVINESKEKFREEAQRALRMAKRRYGFPLDSGKDS